MRNINIIMTETKARMRRSKEREREREREHAVEGEKERWNCGRWSVFQDTMITWSWRKGGVDIARV